jgi:hypothetical protein
LIDKGAYLIEVFNAINIIFGTCLYAYHSKKVWKIMKAFEMFDAQVEST